MPIDKNRETKLSADLMSKLAFSVQKLAEMTAVARGAMLHSICQPTDENTTRILILHYSLEQVFWSVLYKKSTFFTFLPRSF